MTVNHGGKRSATAHDEFEDLVRRLAIEVYRCIDHGYGTVTVAVDTVNPEQKQRRVYVEAGRRYMFRVTGASAGTDRLMALPKVSPQDVNE